MWRFLGNILTTNRQLHWILMLRKYKREQNTNFSYFHILQSVLWRGLYIYIVFWNEWHLLGPWSVLGSVKPAITPPCGMLETHFKFKSRGTNSNKGNLKLNQQRRLSEKAVAKFWWPLGTVEINIVVGWS